MIKLMVMGSIYIRMVLYTLVCGVMINRTDKGMSYGLMVRIIKDLTLMGRSKDMECSVGQMGLDIRVISKTILSMGMVYINGMMAEFTKDIGMIIRCKVKVISHGQMAENIK